MIIKKVKSASGFIVPMRMGFSIADIGQAFADLQKDEAPSKADWSHTATAVQGLIDEHIATLERIRKRLTACLGCGCLSLKACALYNPEDRAGNKGPGQQHVLKSPTSDANERLI